VVILKEGAGRRWRVTYVGDPNAKGIQPILAVRSPIQPS
jgi:hypothetical protein